MNRGDNQLKMTLYSIPNFISHRYNLQFISVSYSYYAITSHMSTMRMGMEEAYRVWITALRQLDMKFDNLSNLLIQYGVIDKKTNDKSNNNNNDDNDDPNEFLHAEAIRL